MASLPFQLHELQDRNAECLGMLHESQEEVKLLRSRASSVACLCHPQSRGAFPVVTNTSSMAHTSWHTQLWHCAALGAQWPLQELQPELLCSRQRS